MISKIIVSAFTMAATLLLTGGKQTSHLQSRRSPLIVAHTVSTQMGNFVPCLALPPSVFQGHQHKRRTTPWLKTCSTDPVKNGKHVFFNPLCNVLCTIDGLRGQMVLYKSILCEEAYVLRPTCGGGATHSGKA